MAAPTVLHQIDLAGAVRNQFRIVAVLSKERLRA
jgi:hypothetical protein